MPVDPVSLATKHNTLYVPNHLLDQARRASRKDQAQNQAILERIFKPAEPAPGVIPQTPEGKLALDDFNTASTQNIEISAWGAQWATNSIIGEGQTFLGYAYLSELAQRPEFRAIVETISYEMTREGVEFRSASGEDKAQRIKELEDEFKAKKVISCLAKAAAHDGFFGRGHIFIDVGDDMEDGTLRQSIGDGVDRRSKSMISPEKKVKHFINVEPVWTYPTRYNSNNPLTKDWYNPEYWFVMGRELHRSRLLTFVGREVPDLLKPTYSFGGLSMTQMALPYVQNWLRTRQAVADLIYSFSVWVLKTNLNESLQADGQLLFNRAELFNLMKSNQGLMLLDKDMEEFANVSTSIGGLEGLQAQSQEHMAAVSRIPLIKLLGITPTGLNASSEGELRTFYDWIHAFQEHLFRDNPERMMHFLMLSLWGEVDEDIVVDFKSLWQLDEAGQVGVQKTRADIDDAYVAMGVVTPEEIRERLAQDDETQYQGIDLDQPLPPDPMEMMGGGGDPNEEKIQTPGGTLHPKDPANRAANQVTNRSMLGSPGPGGLGGAMAGTGGGDGETDHQANIAHGIQHAMAVAGYDGKFSKEYAKYEEVADHPSQECSNCLHFHDNLCDVVAGIIEPTGWCEFHEDVVDAHAHDMAMDAGIEWKEDLHPRGPGGKFASHKGTSSGIHKTLSAHGFKTNKAVNEATYTKGEHKYSVKAHPNGEGTPSTAWHHHGTKMSGVGSGALMKHLASQGHQMAAKAAAPAGPVTAAPPTNPSKPPTQAPAPMTPKFVPKTAAFKEVMDDFGLIPQKESQTQQKYGLPGGGTVVIKQLKFGMKWTLSGVPGHGETTGKDAHYLAHYLGKWAGLSPENMAKLGPMNVPQNIKMLFSTAPVGGSMDGEKATIYGLPHKDYKWSSHQSLTVGMEPGKNEGKWKITQGGSSGKVLAKGYGVQELNAAFEALHPRGPGGKFMAKPGTDDFSKEVKQFLGDDWKVAYKDEGLGNVSLTNGDKGNLIVIEGKKWGFTDSAGTMANGEDLESLYKHIVGLPTPTKKVQTDKIKLADLKKVSSQKGSNPGGVYENDTGDKFYVKHLQSPDHVKNERLAAALYKIAGSGTLDYVDVDDDPKSIASKLATLKADNVSQLSESQKQQARQDFAIHAWLANWDAVGLSGDNLGCTEVGGRPVNLDLGGSLAYRAQGSPKGDAFGESVNEWDTLRDPVKNASSAALFGSMSKEDMKKSADRLSAITASQINDAVKKAGYEGDAAIKLAAKLMARKQDVINRGNKVTAFEAPFSFDGPDSGPSITSLGQGISELGTSAERSAVTTYSGGAYTPINEALRYGLHEGSEHKFAKTIDNITSWLNKASFPADAVCTRRVSASYANFLLSIATKGTVFTDLGFASTSRTGKWSGNVTCQIKIPKGAKAMAIKPISQHPGEDEVLIQRGTRYKVVDFDPKTKTLYCEIDQKHLVEL